MTDLPLLRFEYPWLLLALLPLVVVIWLMPRRRLSAVPAWQRRTALLGRSTLAVALVAALAGPALVLSRPARSMVFVVDVSDSVAPEQQARARAWVREAQTLLGPESRTAVVEFAERPRLVPGSAGAAAAEPTEPLTGGSTNLEHALRLSEGLLPNGREGEIVLLTDGWENAGSAWGSRSTWVANGELREGTARGEADGARVSFVTPDLAGVGPEVALTAVEVPPAVRVGDALDVGIVLQSSEQVNSRVRTWLDGRPLPDREVALAPGTTRLALSPRVQTTGFHTVRVEVEPEQDTRTENNTLDAVSVAHDAGQVLLLENQPGEGAALAEVLAADGVAVETRPVSSVPPSSRALREFETVVLVNTPATSLTLDQQQTLDLFVKEDGHGLVLVGGPLSFGPGAYEDTVLDTLSPVSAKPPDTPQQGSVALLIVLDRSASMDITRRGEVPKLAMAREAAIQATDLLKPNDVVGVIAFDTEWEWVVPVTRIRSTDEVPDIQARIAGIESGGGTTIFPALEAAYEAAAEAEARLRHIVLLTDGQSNERGYTDLIQRMRPYQVTLSSVAIGADADTKLLSELAKLGEGRYYFTERPAQIPRIASKETTILTRNTVVEGQVAALVRDPSPLLRGLSGELPPLQGYVATTPKERAITALGTERGHPLLAHWQYGIGRVVAWTSDPTGGESGWASEWSAGWAEAARFWSQAVRWSMPAPVQPELRVEARVVQGREALLRVESVQADGSFGDLLDVRATVVLPNGVARELTIPQQAPGLYERRLDVDAPGIYRALVSQRDAGGEAVREELVGFAAPSAPELRSAGVNRAFLEQLAQRTGGRELRTPTEVLAGAATTAEQRVPLWPWLAALALLVLPFDVAVRRLRWPWFG